MLVIAKTYRHVMVRTLTMLTHPSNYRQQLAKGSIGTEESFIKEFGLTNYNFAIEQKWIEEIK